MSKLLPVFACATLLAACSGEGSSRTTPPGPVAVHDPGASSGAARRPQSAVDCSGIGTGAVVVGGSQNVAAGQDSAVVDGANNQACDSDSFIGGGYGNRISSGGADTSYASLIGGGEQNSITGNGSQAMIGAGQSNALSGPNAVIGGGYQNTVSAGDSTVGGGSSNTISGGGTQYGTIGGGANNSVTAVWGTVAGGNTNSASGNGANVAGGANNVASGAHATVLGGSRNTASAPQSLAAGVNSNAATAGAWVWSDDSTGAAQLSSTAPNQFLARASGGFTFWTNAANTVGARLAPGSGAWESASDRRMKTDVARIDDAAVLERVARLPISSWSYVTERGVRHVGPMAQDFYAAFGVGEDDRHITSIDEDGVALSAIKALYAENAALRSRDLDLQRQIDLLSASVRTMREQARRP